MGKLTRVQFVVDQFGDDPRIVTKMIGFEPTGTAVCGWSSLPKQTSWFVELTGPVPEKLEDRIAALVQMLENHAEGVRAVSAKFRARIEIHVDDRDWIWPYDPDGYRSGYFDVAPAVVAEASGLGLGIAVHLTTGLEQKAE